MSKFALFAEFHKKVKVATAADLRAISGEDNGCFYALNYTATKLRLLY